MTGYIAALPMYDWPECRAEVDEQWVALRERLRAAGIEAPDRLVRRNADMPSVPGGIRDSEGEMIAPDPATLPPDELDLHTLWRHPALLFAQTCWGPMVKGLAQYAQTLGQQDYSGVEGGVGQLYSSALVARRTAEDVPAPSDGDMNLPIEFLRGKRLAYNAKDSMSGNIGLGLDLARHHEDRSIFSSCIETGGHRNSIIAVAEGRADVAAVDCLTWQLAKRYEPESQNLAVVGWTVCRNGLPYIASFYLPDDVKSQVAQELKNLKLELKVWDQLLERIH
ncbi:ABC-type phosphate/phosphonate transport system, periplasmic component [Xylaria bambusicola]|uniref:ABC-type phosphate/phosphonate transport system, periplasmic component n=1 Tax=Xylaria bambusicola TaxID=326684 RepID=UPI0020089E88|nr:ABC-type phosphate/phosphonate transport system, periplasmic component [Xylaria bambusicola]KAI0521613.1 ABC-type phosphate/phosphonate transport system, periplasmic component [Xylaria bambusicola]